VGGGAECESGAVEGVREALPKERSAAANADKASQGGGCSPQEVAFFRLATCRAATGRLIENLALAAFRLPSGSFQMVANESVACSGKLTTITSPGLAERRSASANALLSLASATGTPRAVSPVSRTSVLN
jgi:hypothetical protein